MKYTVYISSLVKQGFKVQRQYCILRSVPVSSYREKQKKKNRAGNPAYGNFDINKLRPRGVIINRTYSVPNIISVYYLPF